MANRITLVRTLLAFLVAAMLQIRSPGVYVTAAVLTVVVILLDALDGWVARRYNECSKFGALADILGDRVTEMTYWIAFAALGWVPAWVAVVFAARGIVVDGLRSMALESGLSAFGMMRTRLGKLLVSSRSSRALYGAGKLLAFTLIILLFTPGLVPAIGGPLRIFTYTCVYATVVLCIVRGAPVLAEGRRFI